MSWFYKEGVIYLKSKIEIKHLLEKQKKDNKNAVLIVVLKGCRACKVMLKALSLSVKDAEDTDLMVVEISSPQELIDMGLGFVNGFPMLLGFKSGLLVKGWEGFDHISADAEAVGSIEKALSELMSADCSTGIDFLAIAS